MDNIHDRFLYSWEPIGGLEDQLKACQPRRIYSGSVRNIFPLHLCSESRDKFAKGSRVDVTQVDEEKRRRDGLHIAGGFFISENVRSPRRIAFAQRTHSVGWRIAYVVQ